MDDAQVDLLLDPQTSGGLLIGVAETGAEGLLAALRRAGCAEAAVVGRVTAGADIQPLIVHGHRMQARARAEQGTARPRIAWFLHPRDVARIE